MLDGRMRIVFAAPEIWYFAATAEEKDMDPFDCPGDVLPGLEAGVEAMVIAARPWLAAPRA
jgi:hypothetical protein